MELTIFSGMLVFVAAVVTASLTPLTIILARKCGLMDFPDSRKVHVSPTPRLAGIALAVGMLVAGAAGVAYLSYQGKLLPPGVGLQLLAIAGAGAFVFLVGLVDDMRSVSSRYKLLTLIAASLMVCGAGATFDELLFGGQAMLQFQWIAWLVTMLWIITIAVAINFIDGLDGLAGGVSLLAAGVLAFFLLASGNLAAAILPLVMCGSLVGFLVFNWHPAKTFMGDGGSLTLGFLIGAATVMANPLVGTMRGVVLPALALSVPLTEAALTMFRRHYLQRRSVFSAERGHIHHLLLERGLTHRQAVLIIYVVSILAVSIGLITLQFEGWGTLGGLALVAPLLWGTFRLAGSLKTSEMIEALRQKRSLDRMSRQYRTSFEELQLEFNQVSSFSEWWQAVCRSAERLTFIRIRLPITSRDGATRTLEWNSTDDHWGDCARITATLPIADRRRGCDALQATVEIAAATSLESAGERLALFSRLMAEHSLASLRHHAVHGQSLVTAPARPRRPIAADCGRFGHLRVAVVHDFLYTYCGAERVLEQLINIFPHCDVFALFDFLPDEERHFLKGKTVTTSFIQRMPLARTKHRAYLPIMPLAIEQFDLSQYDLIVSSSYLVAKGVITGPDQLHVCYCHSPVRYAWDLQHQYLSDAGLGFGPKGLAARWLLHYLRNWDSRSSAGVDHFIANSRFVSRRISKCYRREATIIHPPVETETFVPDDCASEDYYLVVGRMVPYKATDLVVEAFSQTPHRKLKVIGTGPEFKRVQQLAGPNVELLGHQGIDQLVYYLQRAKALIFAAEEDFGIVPVEAMACGTPVIAFGKGGATETVEPGKHGLYFEHQTVESLLEAIDRFEALPEFDETDRAELRRHAEGFSSDRFVWRITEKIGQWVIQKWPERGNTLGRKSNSKRDASYRSHRSEASSTSTHLAMAVPTELNGTTDTAT